MCDQKEAKRRLGLLKIPPSWSEGLKERVVEYLLISSKTEVNPISTLGSLELWMEMDRVNTYFDTLYMMMFCDKILVEIIDELRFHNGVDRYPTVDSPYTFHVKILSTFFTEVNREEQKARKDPGISRPKLEQMKRVHKIMQDHYLKRVNRMLGKRTWAGDVCITNVVGFADKKRLGRRATPESFFDGHGFDYENSRLSDEETGPVSAHRLYKNWNWGEAGKGQSKLFTAIQKHRDARYGCQIEREEEAQLEEEKNAKGAEEAK